MNRHKAVQVVSDDILKDGLVDALFLKGSIARGDDDDYSDVDMYAVVSSENLEAFLNKRIQYLEKYKPLVFWCEEDFVAPQIIGVFEDTLHFDLYTVKTDSIPQTDDIKVIFDKDGILDSYRKVPLNVSSNYIIKEISEFAFTLLEFEAAYARKDYIWAIALFHLQIRRISFFTRFIHDAGNARLGLKRIHKAIPDDVYKEYISILEKATPTNILVAMKQLLALANDIILQLPDEVLRQVNRKFFDLMQSKIATLE